MKHFLLSVGVLLGLATHGLRAQDRAITGKVTANEDGSALPGVSVIIKGTTTGTSTDVDGSYRLADVPANGTLVFSFIGLLSEEQSVGTRTKVDVAMRADVRQLSEIVVTGVGSATDKRKLGIAVESLTAKNIPAVPTASIDQALVGKIAGAQISSTDGTPGASINILLRGINSINRGTQPMILVDGVQMGSTDLNSLDLTMIERVEVVQGAAAATIYGAQGANGVIQLFTKKGKAGQLNIDVSSSASINTALNVGNVRKAALHGFNTNAQNDVIGSSGKPLTFNPTTSTYSENLIWASTNPATLTNKPYDRNLKYYDHYAMFFVPATTFNNSVSVSGGKDKLDFGFSLSNLAQGSNIRDNGDYNRTNLTANIGVELARGLRFRTTTQLAYTRNTINWAGRDILYALNNTRPFANYDLKDADGNYAAYFGGAAGVNGQNPNYWQQYRKTTENRMDIVQSLNLNYNVNKFLELDAKYGINYQKRDTREVWGNQTQNANSNKTQTWVSRYNDGANTGEIVKFAEDRIFQNFLATATIRTDFAKDFGWNVPIRTTTQATFDWRSQNLVEYWTYGLNLPTFTPFNATQATTYRIQRDRQTPFVTYGYFVNQRVEFGELAGVSGGFRTDYSSAFGRGSTPFTFGRADAYFRISELDFWKNSRLGSVIPEWKVRGAWGQAGIQPKPFDRYVTLSPRTIGSTNAFFADPAQNNTALGVEVSEEVEIGTDFTLALGRGKWFRNVNFSSSYWKRSTKNAIFDLDVAPSTGVGTVKDNAFSLASNGFQFSINAAVVSSKDFNWNFTTNFGRQSSEITAVRGPEVVITSVAGSTNYVLKPGEKIGQLYGFKILRSLDATAPDGTAFIPESQRANYVVASNGYVVNRTTKAPFFTPTQYSFGDPNPLFNTSFINDFTYKGFLTVSFQLDWVQGSHLYNQTKGWMYRDGISSDYEGVIDIPGANNESRPGAWTAFYRGVYAERQRNGTKDYFYEDASFVRLRNVSVGFDLARVTKIPLFRRAQIVVSGRNLLTFTKYTGMDPEISSGTVNSAWDRGTDHNTMPNIRTYQFTLNLGF